MSTSTHHVEHQLTEQYPVIYRMAYALCGQPTPAKAVIDQMLRRGLERTVASRQDPPARWFEHHTILTIRRMSRSASDPTNDTLLPSADGRTPAYIAFIRAVRALPEQQREALILHHAGGFDLRRLAVAMDCSTEAAANHLNSAVATLRAMAGADYEVHLATMQKVYAALLPTEDIYLPPVQRTIRRKLRLRRLFRIIVWIIVIFLFSLAAYAAWIIYPLLDT